MILIRDPWIYNEEQTMIIETPWISQVIVWNKTRRKMITVILAISIKFICITVIVSIEKFV